jgi:hypothetical protein
VRRERRRGDKVEETDSSKQGLTDGLPAGLFRTHNTGSTHTLKDMCGGVLRKRNTKRTHTQKTHAKEGERQRGVCMEIKGSAEAGGPTDAAYQLTKYNQPIKTHTNP